MAVYDYNDVPVAGNKPSVDQPDMLENTISIRGLINEDHIGFNTSNGGLHKQIRMPTQASIPASLITNEGTVYTKLATTKAATTEGTLFYTPGTTGKEYQLTRTINADFATFSTNTTYIAGPPAKIGGWTFLPGGMLMQYGFSTSDSSGSVNCTVNFPERFFNTVYSVTCTVFTTTNSRFFITVHDVADNRFRAVLRDSGGAVVAGESFYWMAIGK